MSMIGNIVALPPEHLDRLIADPSALPALVYPDAGQVQPQNMLVLEKTWHGLHFLLTGQAWGGVPPLADAILGGTEFGDDVGYGPARYLRPHQVEAVAAALAGVSRAQLALRYAPAAFAQAEIYPTGIWEREGRGALDELLDYFDVLVVFYKDAAARGDGVVLFLN